MHHFLGTASDILSSASQVPQMVAYPIGSTVPIKTMNVLSDAAEPSDAFPTVLTYLPGAIRANYASVDSGSVTWPGQAS